jgi:hypothetical protein
MAYIIKPEMSDEALGVQPGDTVVESTMHGEMRDLPPLTKYRIGIGDSLYTDLLDHPYSVCVYLASEVEALQARLRYSTEAHDDVRVRRIRQQPETARSRSGRRTRLTRPLQ